jgi:hypothetical protein
MSLPTYQITRRRKLNEYGMNISRRVSLKSRIKKMSLGWPPFHNIHIKLHHNPSIISRREKYGRTDRYDLPYEERLMILGKWTNPSFVLVQLPNYVQIC